MIFQRTLYLKSLSTNSNLQFERPAGGERAVLVHVNFVNLDDQEDLDEFVDLVQSTDAELLHLVTTSRSKPDVKYFVGSGKAKEIQEIVEQENVDIVLFNHPLSPSQQRNLERLFNCRVLDRTGLILDIFALRARTFEGKLQVELAQLQHLATRLVRGWTHLERQKGGIGLRGPGETQLETDRRLIRARIKNIQNRLQKVRKQREQGRRSRKKSAIPTVSFVGYTNAGKSTLFNTVTSADVYTADQLFATLDPTLRQLKMPQLGNIVFADTVGFIRHLPHDLVDAFRATLEETRESDLLIHVVDYAHPQRGDFIHDVNVVLEEIGAKEIPQIIVFNKIDLLPDVKPHLETNKVWLSAKNGEGIELLQQLIVDTLSEDVIRCDLFLKPSEGKLRAQLHRMGVVLSENNCSEGGWQISVRMQRRDYERLIHHG